MIDAQRLGLMLNELRLPTIKHIWGDFAAQADKEGWPASRFLAALAEHELAERDRRRIGRHLAEAHLPAGKTLDCFAFEAVPMISKAQVMALCAGDGWLDQGSNLILFGPPGGGKSHLAAAIGLALVENGWRALFTRTSDLVQRLQVARRELTLESAIAKLDKYHLLILDDFAYVSRDQGITSRFVRQTTISRTFREHWSCYELEPRQGVVQRPKFAHRNTHGLVPKIIAGKADVRPAHRRKMGEECRVKFGIGGNEVLHGPIEIERVPIGNRGN
jgi:hypothetical protein